MQNFRIMQVVKQYFGQLFLTKVRHFPVFVYFILVCVFLNVTIEGAMLLCSSLFLYLNSYLRRFFMINLTEEEKKAVIREHRNNYMAGWRSKNREHVNNYMREWARKKRNEKAEVLADERN